MKSRSKLHVYKTLIVASSLWIFVLFSFYYSLDPELHHRHHNSDSPHQRKLVNFPAKSKNTDDQQQQRFFDFDDVTETTEPSVMRRENEIRNSHKQRPARSKHKKKQRDKLSMKKLVTPVPSEIIAELGLQNSRPGEMGFPVALKNVSTEVQRRIDLGWKRHEFNEFVSDLISVRRSLPDPRDAYCKRSDLYLSQLPSTSVIFIFHNEAWSTLLRSVHSVLDRSPSHLIEEIILVDDFSDMRK